MSNNELFYAELTRFLYFDMFEIFLGSSLSRSSTYVQFNYESYTNISFAPNFMLVTTSKVCADGSRPFPSNKYDPKLPSALAETSRFKSRDQISRLPCSRYVVDVIIFTYTKTSNTTCPISLRMYRQSSAWLFSNPSFAMAASSFTFHCRPACLSP